jgi:hypothetical protein
MIRTALILISILITNVSFAQSAPLRVEIKLPSATMKMGEPVSMTVLIQNIDPQRSIALRGHPGFTEGGGLELIAMDSGRTQRKLPDQTGVLTLAQAQAGTSRVVLPPGRSVTIPMRRAAEALFPRPGTYDLVVSYQSPIPTPGNRSIESGVVEGSSAVSAPISIEVIE